jgi:hypothetical protein
VELVFCVDIVFCWSTATSGSRDGVFAIVPLIRQAHEVVDGPWLAASKLFLEIASEEAVAKGVDGPFGRDIFRRVPEADPP